MVMSNVLFKSGLLLENTDGIIGIMVEINKKLLGQRIKFLRTQNGLSATQLADKIGLSRPALSMVENGNRGVSIEMAKKIATLFDVAIDYLLGNTDTPNSPSIKEILEAFNKSVEEKQKNSILTKVKLKLIPVYDGANAGEIGAFPDANVIQFFATIPIDSTGRYGVIIHGDSMEPEIRDGDVAVIDPNQEVSNGKKAVVSVDGGVLVKRIYRQNGTVTLVSDNPEYPPIVIKSSDFPIYLLGKVVWILKREP